MPSSYTATIYEKNQSFEDFVWLCARGMGALVSMREMPLNAKIPDEFIADTQYYDKQIKDSQTELSRINKMSDKQCEQESQKEFDNRIFKQESEEKSRKERLDRFQKMLSMVEEWQPPTADHTNFKQFMINQLEETFNFDLKYHNNKINKLTSKEWRYNKIKNFEDQIVYAKKHISEEIARTSERNRWIKALRDSLSHD